MGVGLFGAVFDKPVNEAGMKAFVIDKCSHIGDNAYTGFSDGAHVFHTK